MIIYKITNKQNNKVYIGQTINSLNERWQRHQTDALNNILDTHFARAIRYYGPDAFTVEVIDTADTQKELSEKERYWIQYYDAVNTGYNETDAIYKSGGNTYQSKTSVEMASIREKIRQSKLGKLNPHATGVKCKNIDTNEEYHFDTQRQMQEFFNEPNHQFCSRRCLHKIKSLYRDCWLIAYENEDYPTEYTTSINKRKTGTQIQVQDLITNQIYIFKSYREAERELPQLPSRQIIAQIATGKRPQLENYIITKID